jgi:hypothetical protein
MNSQRNSSNGWAPRTTAVTSSTVITVQYGRVCQQDLTCCVLCVMRSTNGSTASAVCCSRTAQALQGSKASHSCCRINPFNSWSQCTERSAQQVPCMHALAPHTVCRDKSRRTSCPMASPAPQASLAPDSTDLLGWANPATAAESCRCLGCSTGSSSPHGEVDAAQYQTKPAGALQRPAYHLF